MSQTLRRAGAVSQDAFGIRFPCASKVLTHTVLLTNQPLFATIKKRYFHTKREETLNSRKLQKTKERKPMYAKIIGLAFALVVSVAAGVFATEVQIAADGTLLVAETKKTWQNTGVQVSDDARPYDDALLEAYKNPGKAVPVKTHRERKLRWLEITVTTIADASVVYDEKERRIHLVTDAFVVETETRVSLFLIFAGIAVLAMIVLNILVWRGSFGLVAFASIAAGAAAATTGAAAGLVIDGDIVSSLAALFFAAAPPPTPLRPSPAPQ